jgi:hypothetical protein
MGRISASCRRPKANETTLVSGPETTPKGLDAVRLFLTKPIIHGTELFIFRRATTSPSSNARELCRTAEFPTRQLVESL